MNKQQLKNSKILYLNFGRYLKVINDVISIENFDLHSRVNAGHLLALAQCKLTVVQQDYFVKKIVLESMNIAKFSEVLKLSIDKDNSKININGLLLYEHYCFKRFNIQKDWNENAIRMHLETNIFEFIRVFLGDDWAALPRQTLFFGGVVKFPDFVFYNCVTHQYLVIDLKVSGLSTEVDRSASQMAIYLSALDARLNLKFQKPTIGIILAKGNINSEYFKGINVNPNIFQRSFSI